MQNVEIVQVDFFQETEGLGKLAACNWSIQSFHANLDV
jgi:hypothetical protein